jgi:signal transduction histidine kinase
MGSIGRLVRTTAFKLSFVYLVVFSGLTLFLVYYISNNTADLLDRQIADGIASEIASLSDQYRAGGLRQLVATVEMRSRRPGASLYLVADPSGGTVVGNVADPPLAVLGLPDGKSVEVSYQRLDDAGRRYIAVVRVFGLPGGFKLLVGRDIGEVSDLRQVIFDASKYALVVILALGFLSWFFVARSVLKRVENVAETSRQIMSGDLTRRLSVTGSGDEFDNLALSLNEMLARIEALMTGLKEVSDNIAHDLKTPLSRLHNRLEEILRRDGGVEDYRGGVEASLEEADKLIQVFDAVLKIARMEAGSSGDSLDRLDAREVLDEIDELYAPVVEDAGGRLELLPTPAVCFRGNRMLVSQALANLIDNAIKYAAPADDETRTLAIRLAAREEGEELAITVADNGPGIAPENRERVLQRFVRLDESRSRQGSGLGLSLVAAVVRMHGGRIRLGDAGPGLEATLCLPIVREQSEEAGEHGGRDGTDGGPGEPGA